MPIYYFNFFDGYRWTKDFVGQEVENLDYVKLEAKRALAEICLGHFADLSPIRLNFDVLDEAGKSVCRAAISLHAESLTLNSSRTSQAPDQHHG